MTKIDLATKLNSSFLTCAHNRLTWRNRCYYEGRRERPPKFSRHTKVTAHPAIGLFSDYVRKGARIAQRKEKRESRRKTFLHGKYRLSIFRKVAEYNPSLSYKVELLLFDLCTYNSGPPAPLQTEFSRFCEMKYLLKQETHNKNEENTLKELNEIFLMVYGLPK